MSSEKPGYSVAHEVRHHDGKIQYTARGPGISDVYDKPWFDTEEQAATLCRVLARAFQAGEDYRAVQIAKLLEPSYRR